jgi:hypothetical protein
MPEAPCLVGKEIARGWLQSAQSGFRCRTPALSALRPDVLASTLRTFDLCIDAHDPSPATLVLGPLRFLFMIRGCPGLGDLVQVAGTFPLC